MLDPNFGLGAGLGLPFLQQDWLGKDALAVGVVIFIVSWQFIPFHSLIYQGGVRQIPRSLYEAAELDGAGRMRQFFSITLPQLKYTIITSSTLMVVGSLTFFDLIFVLTAGGPGDATRVLALDMYKRGFMANQMGPASVIAVILVPSSAWRSRCCCAASAAATRATASWKVPDMAAPTTTPASTTEPCTAARARRRRSCGSTGGGGTAGWIWLVIGMLPIYWIVITSFKTAERLLRHEPARACPTSRSLDTTSW